MCWQDYIRLPFSFSRVSRVSPRVQPISHMCVHMHARGIVSAPNSCLTLPDLRSRIKCRDGVCDVLPCSNQSPFVSTWLGERAAVQPSSDRSSARCVSELATCPNLDAQAHTYGLHWFSRQQIWSSVARPELNSSYSFSLTRLYPSTVS